MNYAFVLLLCIASVHSQPGPGRPPKPPLTELEGTTGQGVPVRPPEPEAEVAPPKPKAPVKQSPVITIPASPEPPTKPKLPFKGKGCYPGCGHTELCAELGLSYCRPGQSCSVCIKMTSIRLPASAVYGMYQPKPKAPQVTMPAQVIPSQPPTQTTDIFMQMQNSMQMQNQQMPSYDVVQDPNQQQQQQNLLQTSAFSYTEPTQQTQQQPQQQQPSDSISFTPPMLDNQPGLNNPDSYNPPVKQTNPQRDHIDAYVPQMQQPQLQQQQQQKQQQQQPQEQLQLQQQLQQQLQNQQFQQNQRTNAFGGYYDTQPVNNNLDFFGFPIQTQQQTTNSFNSMFPFLWMGDFGMGF